MKQNKQTKSQGKQNKTTRKHYPNEKTKQNKTTNTPKIKERKKRKEIRSHRCKHHQQNTKDRRQNLFTSPTTDRGLISTIYKEHKKIDCTEKNNPIKKWGSNLNKEFPAEEC